MDARTEELRAVLAAYKAVMDASRPDLHPMMAKRAASWAEANEGALRAELDSYLREASRPDCAVRVFWKMGQELKYGGCNEHFARDGGMPNAAAMVGADDFDKRLSWRNQAAKYRKDDKAVLATGKADLMIVERQETPDGKVIWLRTGKAPIKAKDGKIIGILGMYEVVDEKTGLNLFASQMRKTAGVA